jgi:hypothetical protein
MLKWLVICYVNFGRRDFMVCILMARVPCSSVQSRVSFEESNFTNVWLSIRAI